MDLNRSICKRREFIKKQKVKDKIFTRGEDKELK
jgi:hypothetical protein